MRVAAGSRLEEESDPPATLGQAAPQAVRVDLGSEERKVELTPPIPR